MTTLGRIDPLTHHPDGTPIDPTAPASSDVVREMHADLVRGQGRALLASAPLLVLAIGALAIGGAFPQLFGMLIWVGVLGVGAYVQETFEWFTLRRADPLTLLGKEAQEDSERKAFEEDFRTRANARRPIATLGLAIVVGLVTAIEFVRVARVPVSSVLASAALVKPAVRAGEWWRLLTATYMHGSLVHLLANLSALVILGELVEAYEGRLRVPLVYLVAAVGGSICSSLMSATTSVGASGGILGLAGYLVAAAGRSGGGTPRILRRRMLRLLGSTAVMGLAGINFIDNAAHLGGLLGGAAIGFALPRGDARRESIVAALGVAAIAILAAGAVFTVYRLLR